MHDTVSRTGKESGTPSCPWSRHASRSLRTALLPVGYAAVTDEEECVVAIARTRCLCSWVVIRGQGVLAISVNHGRERVYYHHSTMPGYYRGTIPPSFPRTCNRSLVGVWRLFLTLIIISETPRR